MSKEDDALLVDEDQDIPDKLYFRIGEVAELVGVESHVLRYWEGEFKMRPHRSSSGQRLYRKRDISRFLKIKRLLHTQGFTIAGARKALLPKEGEEQGGDGNLPVDLDKLREVVERVARVRVELNQLRRALRTLDASVASR